MDVLSLPSWGSALLGTHVTQATLCQEGQSRVNLGGTRWGRAPGSDLRALEHTRRPDRGGTGGLQGVRFSGSRAEPGASGALAFHLREGLAAAWRDVIRPAFPGH